MKFMKNVKSEEGKAKASIDNKHSMLELACGSLMLAIFQCTAMVLSNNTLADQKKHDDCLRDHAETLVNHSHSGRLLWSPSMLPQGNQTSVCSGPCADSCDSLLVDKVLVFSLMMLVLGGLTGFAFVHITKVITVENSRLESDATNVDEKTPFAQFGAGQQLA
mgnify:CR=1 FL=1|jgi:hypothetical protein